MNTSLNTIVIGSDLSSLAAALVSAYHGKSTVLVMERDFPSSFSENDYVFDTRRITLGGINPRGTLYRLLKALDLSLPGNTRVPPPLQAIHADHRITLFNDPDRLAKEFEREFGISPENLRNLHAKMLTEIEHVLSPEEKGVALLDTKSRYQMLLSSLREIIWKRIIFPLNFYKMKKTPRLADTFRGLSAVISNIDSERIDPLSLSYSLLILSKGVFLNHDEYDILTEQLREKFESLGGHVVKDCDIQTVSMRPYASVEVKIGEDLFIIDGESIIASAKWDKVSPLLLDNNRRSGTSRKYATMKSSFLYPFTFFMGVRERGLPEMMSENVIVMADGSRHFLTGDILIISRSPYGDTSYAPEESCALSITMFLETPPRQLTDSVLRHLIHSSLEALGDFLPFLCDNIDFIAEETSITLSREYQDVVNRKIRVKKGLSSKISFPLAGRNIENIAITGGELLPAFGIEGEILSGIEAAKRII